MRPITNKKNHNLILSMISLIGGLGIVFRRIPQNKAVSRIITQNFMLCSMGGLLSSSCCLLQLLLNSISIGCTGFSFLDSCRPFFLLSTFGTQLSRSFLEYREGVRKPRPILWLLLIVISFSPEIIRFRNQLDLIFPQKNVSKSESNTVEYHIMMSGIKCEACAHGFRTALEAEINLVDRAQQQKSNQSMALAVVWNSVDDTIVYLKMSEILSSERLRCILEGLCIKRGATISRISIINGKNGGSESV